MAMKKSDPVNHPQHYGGDTTYEVIKVLEAWDISDFCLATVITYIARAGKKRKSTKFEDLKKALWYLNRKIEQLEGKRDELRKVHSGGDSRVKKERRSSRDKAAHPDREAGSSSQLSPKTDAGRDHLSSVPTPES